MRKKADVTLDLTVVGIQYRVTRHTRRMIQEKLEEVGPLECRLVREPMNSKDSNAIKVIVSEGVFRNLHLGYLNRHVAKVMAKRIDAREIVFTSAYIASLDIDAGEAELVLGVKAAEAKSLENKLKGIS